MLNKLLLFFERGRKGDDPIPEKETTTAFVFNIDNLLQYIN